MLELRLSKRAVSLQLKRGETYMHDWLEGKSRGELPDSLRAPLAEILKMQPEDLGASPWRLQMPQQQQGMEEDAERYYPPAGSYLSPSQHIAFFRMRSHALDQHPERIMPGHLLAFDLNRVRLPDIQSGTIVVAQRVDKAELLKGHGTIIRQYISPNKLITNSSGDNEIISLDDPALPYETGIRGTLLSVVRDLAQ